MWPEGKTNRATCRGVCCMTDKANDVKGVKCHAYFKGVDGLGTCNTECQWYPSNGKCVMHTPEEEEVSA